MKENSGSLHHSVLPFAVLTAPITFNFENFESRALISSYGQVSENAQ
jgi:hypothetical protein